MAGASKVEYVDGRRVFSGSGPGGADFSISLDPENDGSGNDPSNIPIDDRLKLAGLMKEQIDAYKEKLLNQHLNNLEDAIEVPTAPLTSPLINQMKISNDLTNQKETREILMAKVDTEYKKTDIQIKLRDLELKESSNRTAEASLILQGELYLQMNDFKTHFVELRKTFGSINDKLSSVKSHYDFLKNGTDDLKDSNDNVIKPREVEAKNNAEQHIYKNAENTMNWESTMKEILEHFNTSLGGAGGVGAGVGNIEEESELTSLFNKLINFDKEKFKTELNQNLFKVEV